MNVWNEAQDIDAMSSNQWLNYRDELLDEFYRRGYVLKPTIGCGNCDPAEDYACFSCECEQINQVRGIES
jgi:hypothetical protein